MADNTIPTSMTVGGRTYEIISLLREDEAHVNGSTMIERMKGMDVYLGEDDCEHILAHQSEIPVAVLEKFMLVFMGYRNPVDSTFVACVFCDGVSSTLAWRKLEPHWWDWHSQERLSFCGLRRL